MPIRFLNGMWFFDTPQEAADFHRQLNATDARREKAPIPPDHSLSLKAKRLVLELVKHKDGNSAAAIGKTIGVEATLIGILVAEVSKWGAARGLTKRDMIRRIRRRDPDSDKVVRILKVVSAFAKEVQTGKFRADFEVKGEDAHA
jgi:hypothetical protein